MLALASAWILPGLIGLTLLVAVIRGINVYDEFVEGATDGVQLGVKLIPYIIGIYIAIGLFRETGAVAWLTRLLSPLLTFVGFPAEVLPLVIIRPFSNAAAMGIITDILETYNPDSFTGLLASVMQGSSETTFYVLTVYLGSVGIRRSLYTGPLCLLGDAIGYLAALWMTRLFFGN
ncbi:spore maturation protein [Calderihabitans maritimus]|uniref:Spore maturation protein n=1 Tax=Calderihabitans maritimus TaxID=1246530 RepID=A0A1Z5HR36_9FIRM|nr:nucleoside recognition domain-containing protein [Calderihabitans maritimus]GAW91974.1 spore maturation protein [Calderihabitans maritimus]